MITVIVRWESDKVPEVIEWQMWRQLKGAFREHGTQSFNLVFVPKVHKMDGYSFDQYDTIEEALRVRPPGRLVFLEPKGKRRLSELTPREDIVLVVGNSNHSHIKIAHPDDTYRIDTPQDTDLFGINAAAIALAYWYGQ